MAIENFTSRQFETVLEGAFPGKWESAGNQGGQALYSVAPLPGTPFAILIFSSIMLSGASSKEAGQDSIRAVITRNGKPWGGKPVRWIDRRPGWQGRLVEYLKQLTHQISCLLRPCPSCGSNLVPFVARKGKEENKGRAFVCCKKTGCTNPFWAWVETEDGNPIQANQQAPAPAPVATAQPASNAPTCPECGHHPMVRMSTGKGWRCGAPGNRWNGKARCWTVCNGSLFDNDPRLKSAPATAQPPVMPEGYGAPPETDEEETEQAPPVQAPAVKVSGAVPGFKVDAGALKSAITAAILHLDDDEPDAARAVLYKILEQ